MSRIKQNLADVGIILLGLAFIVFIVWLAIPKADTNGAMRALESAGYRNIQITGAAHWGCGKEDIYRTKFIAVGPSGVQTSGVVCGGILKGSTIRTD